MNIFDRLKRKCSLAVGTRSISSAAALVLFIFGLSSSLSAQRASVARLDSEDIQSGAVQPETPSSGGFTSMSLQIESSGVELTLPSGRLYAAQLIVAFDSRTGLYWWTLQGTNGATPLDRITDIQGRFTFYANDDELVGAQLAVPPPSIWISRSTARTGSIEKARNESLYALQGMVASIEDGTASWQKQVNLWDALPITFFYDLNASRQSLNMTIESIERQGSGWRVTLAGRGDEEAEVFLDSLFLLVQASLLNSSN